jgi:hypothetical protein
MCGEFRNIITGANCSTNIINLPMANCPQHLGGKPILHAPLLQHLLRQAHTHERHTHTHTQTDIHTNTLQRARREGGREGEGGVIPQLEMTSLWPS